MTDHLPSEQELIEKVLNGDRNRYEILIDRYVSMIFYIVRQYVSDEDEAEELGQQIFVKTYEKLHSFNENAKFLS